MSDPSFSDSKFGRWFGGMLLAMVFLTGLLMMLANAASKDVNERLDTEANISKTEELKELIAPVGQLAIGKQAADVVIAKAEPKSGDAVYKAACIACHGAGVAGAPRFGDVAAWTDRAAKGVDGLYANAINGYSGSAGYMPAKGGNPSLSEDEVKAAVDYILASSK